MENRLTAGTSKRIMLRIAYDGTGYAGFQVQPGGIPTIEGVLNETISRLTGETIQVTGGSRTDAGVHAQDNVAVFDTCSRIPGNKFAYALNERLPEQIRIRKSEEVESDFHPRYRDCLKTYEYRICNAPFPDPMKRLYSMYTYWKLDTEAMKRAGQYLVGEHDFRSFASVYSQARTTVRRITELDVREEKINDSAKDVIIRVQGTGFLYNMVRIIAGTLLETGRGAMLPEQVEQALAACDRRAAGPTAPACGLTLMEYRFL